MEALPTTTKEEFKSFYDFIIEEGMEKGIEKGRYQNKVLTVKRGFKLNLTIKQIAELNDISIDEANQILEL